MFENVWERVKPRIFARLIICADCELSPDMLPQWAYNRPGEQLSRGKAVSYIQSFDTVALLKYKALHGPLWPLYTQHISLCPSTGCGTADDNDGIACSLPMICVDRSLLAI